MITARPDFQALKARHAAFLAEYRGQGWDAADAAMAECRRLDAETGIELDVLYDMYRERIDEYRENSPPADWDGVFVATTK